MRNEIRTFVALKVEPNEKVLNQLNSFKIAFKNDGIKWVSEDSFHLTLRFIGNTTRAQLYTLVDGFETIAKCFDSFQLEIAETGYFKSKGKPRALFLKIPESEALSDLCAAVEKVVVDIGFHRELKAFRPHLTLGRIKHLESSTRFYSIMNEFEKIKYQDVKISEFILYQSILQPEGPVYKPIQIFKLK